MAVAADASHDAGCTLLFVEDDPILRMAVRALFEREPWVEQVIACATGTQGLRELERAEASVLLTDARLPDIDLERLLERAATISPATRLVVYTGLDEADAIDRAGDRAEVYVQKGRDPFELVRSLRAMCCAEHADGAREGATPTGS